ncbi:hypothetical protein [Burkholderia contaminans]|uniref:hypothetical protein n=1 Tax=Burkholderia contaminans TaxID=488447 RepID=UPI00158A3833|nr:hypothetical protein [Burkholderia contaminans]
MFLIAHCRVNFPRTAINILRCLEIGGCHEQVLINEFSVIRQAGGAMRSHRDVIGEYVPTVSKPHLGIEWPIQEDVVLAGSVESLPELQFPRQIVSLGCAEQKLQV